MSFTYAHGWYLVAFERNLPSDVSAISVGLQRLVIIRNGGAIRAIEADCPHRGAHLGHGGRFDGDAIFCPFHGLRIQIGPCRPDHLHVREFAVVAVGGLIFVRLSEQLDNGFATTAHQLVTTHTIIPGFELSIRAPAPLIIENGFDNAHFFSVHGVLSQMHSIEEEPGGSLVLRGNLLVAESSITRQFVNEQLTVGIMDRARTGRPIVLRAFSPGLSILEVGGAYPYMMLVGATPTADGTSLLRVSLALVRQLYGDEPSAQLVEHLLNHSRVGIDADRTIWEHLSVSPEPNPIEEIDAPVLRFRQFCSVFEKAVPG